MSTLQAPSLVVHVPHASVVVPDDIAARFTVTREQLAQELLVMTDRYTDELFALPADLATTIVFPVSRLVVDPERFVDDANEPMAKKGMGVIYTRTATGHSLRPALAPDERQELLSRFYDPHHAALTAAVQATLDERGTCLVLDAHSFPTCPCRTRTTQAKTVRTFALVRTRSIPHIGCATLPYARSKSSGGASPSIDLSPARLYRCDFIGTTSACGPS